MATLTYDPTPADQPEFSPEEQEALQVGEQLEQEQNQMLAGKFKSAEDLEQAYIELQKKLGSNGEDNEAVRDEARDEERAEEEVEEEVSPTAELFERSAAEWQEKGELSAETLEQYKSMSSEELINAYIQQYGESLRQQQETPDLTDAQVNTIKNDVGGEAAFAQLMEWANDNLDSSYIESYDNLVETGNFQAIQMALAGIKSAYDASNGYEGRMLTGKPAKSTSDVFRSQAEVVAAMSDPRYDKDPAYRQDVFAKLERSDLQF